MSSGRGSSTYQGWRRCYPYRGSLQPSRHIVWQPAKRDLLHLSLPANPHVWKQHLLLTSFAPVPLSQYPLSCHQILPSPLLFPPFPLS